MNVSNFISALGAEFFTGVPDSKLRPLVDDLMDTYGANSPVHIIAANEGSAVALAAGYHLATGKTPLVYLQNSGLGNVVNPLLSLLHEEVYGIPCVFVIGWRRICTMSRNISCRGGSVCRSLTRWACGRWCSRAIRRPQRSRHG